ncbi:hypothetical protein D3C87_2041240 [compost metagenome]
MNSNFQQVIDNCRRQALHHFRMMNFMKLIGDLKGMDLHYEAYKGWAIHTELLFHTANKTGVRYA